ncbi:hypothetical protein [Halobellus rufus]|uniref:hypothetical protein n=1 Tax=Halobellus rufus TaxID=1448860 RepID=UPI000679DD13|nr:hypothetical protein [Halobellus rufus]
MHATASERPTADRTTETQRITARRTTETRRIDVTDVTTARVAEFAAARASDGDVRFERRGGWTYLVEDR